MAAGQKTEARRLAMADITYLLVLIAHATAGAVWMGGAIYSEAVFNPALSSFRVFQSATLSRKSGEYFTRIVWVAFIVISATGMLMLYAGGWLRYDFLFQTSTGLAMIGGIVLTAAAITNGAIITFVLVPRYPAKVMNAIRINSTMGTIAIVLMVVFSDAVRP